MKVVIDGGKEIEVQNDVKLFYNDIPVVIGGHEEDVRLVVTGTHEGIIMDLEDSEGSNLKTSSETAQEITGCMLDN